jgi:uncharacterized protein YqjF (DUF2071 family)
MIEPISTTAPDLAGRTVATQRWSDLVFMHWRADVALVAPLLPPGTRPDTFDGTTWVGLIGFVLERATLFGSPAIPYFGTFVEVNVRLYAIDELGRRGVVFVSLEASRLAAVIGARAAFSLPYFWGSTRLVRSGGTFDYSAKRHSAKEAHTRFSARPSTRLVVDDELAHFLTARWALFARRRGVTTYLPNSHEPWVLYEASVIDLDDSLLSTGGLPGFASRAPDSVLYSPGVTARFGRGTKL